jgi:hypothetical protein
MKRNGTAGRRTDTRALPTREEAPVKGQRIVVIDPTDPLIQWLEKPETQELLFRRVMERNPEPAPSDDDEEA